MRRFTLLPPPSVFISVNKKVEQPEEKLKKKKNENTTYKRIRAQVWFWGIKGDGKIQIYPAMHQ